MKVRPLKKLNQMGQATIEMILIMTVLFGLSVMISNAFKDNHFFATIIEGPWDYVDGMIQKGSWHTNAETSFLNPNAIPRHGTNVSPNALVPDKAFNDAETCLSLNGAC
jgi:hypothetical protein